MKLKKAKRVQREIKEETLQTVELKHHEFENMPQIEEVKAGVFQPIDGNFMPVKVVNFTVHDGPPHGEVGQGKVKVKNQGLIHWFR